MKERICVVILLVLLAGCVVRPIDQEANAREYFNIPASGKTVRGFLPPYIVDTSVDPLTKSSAAAYIDSLTLTE